ncbi:MAG TPA: hypothetical protein VM819_15700 [Vicinamibacterales bacterium]|nr:hypothetical protein [Vicinamibacterales bacterium]
MFAVFVSIPLVLLPALSVPVQADCGVQPVAPTAVEAPILETFNQRVDAYMQVHNDVERKLSLPWSFDEGEDVFAAVEAMQSGLRTARPDARRGAILTPEVGVLIRARLESRLAACGQQVENVLAFINEERAPDARNPEISEPFPWKLGSAMWPSLLGVLPPLPQELVYRFADRDLVLIDIHADLVVDILANALPAPSHAGHGTHRR